MNHILIVDDEADIRESLEAILREEDYAITSVGTVAEARTLLRDADFQAVLLDIWLPDGDGLDLLGQIRDGQLRGAAANPRPPAPEVIMISGHGTIEAAVRATKLGAYDFLEKPLSLDRTLLVLRVTDDSEADFSKSTRGGGMKKYMNPRGMRILGALDQVAQRHGTHTGVVALAWLMTFDGIVPIPGATRVATARSPRRCEMKTRDTAAARATSWIVI